jgi:IS30 family transposase
MTDEAVDEVATRSREGLSLAVVAADFDVHARTLARELRRAGVSIQKRNGWPQ